MTAPTVYAGFGSRLAASTIDWVASFWAPLIVIGQILEAIDSDAESASTSAFAALLVPVVVMFGYFAYFVARGQTLGMRAAGIRMVTTRTASRPGPLRGIFRAFLNLVLLGSGAALVASMFAFGDPVSRASATNLDLAMYIASIAFVVVLGIVGRIWLLWDLKNQTWHDKACGVMVLRDSSKPADGATC